MSIAKAKNVAMHRSRGRSPVDLYISARLRKRRIMLGISLMKLANILDITYQQVYKYECGGNRVSAGRLFQLAQALGVDVNYFFDGLSSNSPVNVTRPNRLLSELTRNFFMIPNRRHQKAVTTIARIMAETEAKDDSIQPTLNTVDL